MKRPSHLLSLVVVLLVGVAGCGIHGTWRVADVHPYTARSKFPVERMTLREDGSATLRYRGAEGVEETDGKFKLRDNKLEIKTAPLGTLTADDVLITDEGLGMRLLFDTREGPYEVQLERMR